MSADVTSPVYLLSFFSATLVLASSCTRAGHVQSPPPGDVGRSANRPRSFATTEGLTMSVIPGPVEFRMGSPESEVGRNPAVDSPDEAQAWLPGERQVVYFTERGTLVMQDVVTLERRELDGFLPYAPDPFGGIVASPDGRTLYYGALRMESNIWLVRRPEEKQP